MQAYRFPAGSPTHDSTGDSDSDGDQQELSAFGSHLPGALDAGDQRSGSPPSAQARPPQGAARAYEAGQPTASPSQAGPSSLAVSAAAHASRPIDGLGAHPSAMRGTWKAPSSGGAMGGGATSGSTAGGPPHRSVSFALEARRGPGEPPAGTAQVQGGAGGRVVVSRPAHRPLSPAPASVVGAAEAHAGPRSRRPSRGDDGGPRADDLLQGSGPAPYAAAAAVSDGDHRIGTQVLALLERTMQQYWRDKIGMLAELVAPLIFIVLIIVLDIAFGGEQLAEVNPLATGRLAFQANAYDYLTYICYDDVSGHAPIGEFMPCSLVRGSYNCSGDDSGLPVQGLCYLSIVNPITTLVAQFVESLVGPLIAAPTLDAIIAHQWLTKKAGLATDSRTRTALAALSSVFMGVPSSTRYDAIAYSGYLLFAPRDRVPSDLLDYLSRRSRLFPYVNGGVFDTQDAAEAYISSQGGSLESNTSIWGLIVVNDMGENFDVEIHLHNKAIPSVNPTVTLNYRTGYNFDGSDMYLASGFVSLQSILYEYFITTKQNNRTLLPLYNPDVAYPMIAALPTIAGERRYLVALVGPLIAFIVVLAFLYPFSQMTKRVVLEKELRIREAMLIMGLRRASLWICYFTVSFLQMLITSILITVLLCATVVKRSNPFVVFLMLLVFACTLIPLVGLVSTFFSKARLAALMAPLLYFVLSMIIFAMTNAKESVVLGLSIFSPTALAALLSDVILGEGGRGFGASDLRGNIFFEPESYKVMLMLMGDFLLYTLLMLYLDMVVPQEWGSTRHPLFFILDPYRAIQRRCGAHGGSGKAGRSASTSSGESALARSAASADPHRFDPAAGVDPSTGEGKPVSIQLDGLVKRYKRAGTTFTAVDQLSWNLYPGEISVLLGPNGSGKSTTINMMTGMLAADGGDCILDGLSIRESIDAARHQLGFCPQHNILWPDLTCREHLEFFGKIKGLRGAALEDAVTDVLRAVDLAGKINHTPPMLSGGQKRKLSVAIAFVGGNRLVLLDEPTAGMDVAARRHTWSLLRAMAPNRTILLSTHYMDEADLLGDNIAIVSEGVLQCSGSSLFLRSHAGSGYTLRFDLLPLPPSAADTGSNGLDSRWEDLTRSVLGHVPEAGLVLQTDVEMAFHIPLSSEPRLPELLRALEKRGNREMGIRSYALSAPTLEDVFLNIIESAHARSDALSRLSRGSLVPGSVWMSKSITTLDSGMSSQLLTNETTTASAPPETAATALPPPRRGTTSPGSSLALPVEPILLRRLSRASMRFLTDRGGPDPHGGGGGVPGAAPPGEDALVFREPDETAEDSAPTSDTSHAGPEVRGRGVGGDHTRPTDAAVAAAARTGAVARGRGSWGAPPQRHPSSSAPYGCEAAGPLRLTGPGGTPPTGAAPGTSDGADAGPLVGVRELAARADLNVEGVWRVQPVKSRRRLWALQLEAMLFKRFRYSLRDRRMQFFQIVCPVMCILLAMLLQLVDVQHSGRLELEPGALFHSKTEIQTSRCMTMFTPELANQTSHSRTAEHAVTYVDRNFVSGADLCFYLLDTWYTHPEPRYAAIQCVDPDVTSALQTLYPLTLFGKVPYVVLYNTSSRHSLPYAVGSFHRLHYIGAMYRSGLPADVIERAIYRVGVQALPVDKTGRSDNDALASILIGIIVLIPFTFLPANPVAWVVKEREVRARHLQKLSGLSYLLYWAGNMVFDFLAYIISMLLVVAVFAIFQRWEYVGKEAIGATFVSLTLYGLCCCTGAYAVSFFFVEHTTAQVVVMGVSFLTGFVCVVLVFILGMLERTQSTSDTLRWIFRVLPTFSVGEVILSLALLGQNQITDPELTPWSMKVTGWANIYMAGEVPLFALVTLLWDHPHRPSVVQALKDRWGRCRGSPPAITAAGEQVAGATVHTTDKDAGHLHRRVSRRNSQEARQLLAAAAAAQYRRETLLRRQSLHSHSFTDPLSGSGGAPVAESAGEGGGGGGESEGAAAGRRGPAPRVGFALDPPSEGAEELQKRTVGVPALAVRDLAQRRSRAEDSGRTPLGRGGGGGEAGEHEEASATSTTATLGGAVSIHVDSSVAARRGTARVPPTPVQIACMYPAPALEEVDTLAMEEEDSDVEDERLAVYQDERALRTADVVRLVDLRKVYPNGKVAVRSLSFGVMTGEVFGFLGTNGAGKSTAISILTQEQGPTSGRAYVCGFDVVRESADAMKCIGYCPQFDACFDLMTVSEHLHFYARIRGIDRVKREELVAQLMELCDLTTYADVLSQGLSGGNRRKLSVAVALLGAPQVVCLDEPSAGMDPIARRLLWRTLDRVSQKCSIVLTTHHLEEVEALADTVAIMVDGALRCIGDLPHLKHKYARNAYELCIRVSGAARGTGADPLGQHTNRRSSTGPPVGATRKPSVRVSVDVVATPAEQHPHSARARSQSITYGGTDFVDEESELVHFMETHLPSAVLIESFNDERYVYSIPATRDVAVAMAVLQEKLQRRRSSVSQGSMSSTARGRAASVAAAAAAAASAKIVRLSDVFGLLQEHQARLGITEYSVSQMSLEQVFLRVAHDEDGESHETSGRASPHRKSTAARRETVKGAEPMTTAVDPEAATQDRRQSASPFNLPSFVPAASPYRAADEADGVDGSSSISSRAAMYQRANSLYQALRLHRRASASASLATPTQRTRAYANSINGHARRAKSVFWEHSADSEAGGVYVAFAAFRRARARQRARAMDTPE